MYDDRESMRSRIRRAHAVHRTYGGTARYLNDAAVPTMSGEGRWWPSTVRAVVNPPRHAAYMRTYRARDHRKEAA